MLAMLKSYVYVASSHSNFHSLNSFTIFCGH
uniref:Uncharacterized protein n=1 Tax=Arundo donax TaxID=35708 RepID=A0A0A9BPU3_ARUDO